MRCRHSDSRGGALIYKKDNIFSRVIYKKDEYIILLTCLDEEDKNIKKVIKWESST